MFILKHMQGYSGARSRERKGMAFRTFSTFCFKM